MSRTAIRLRRAAQSPWTLPVLVVLAFALLPFPALHLIGTLSNTLADRPQWEVTKLRAEGHLMGGSQFRDLPQAMAGEHLNLEAWHGCQEVLSAVTLMPSRIRFRFRYAPSGFLALRFGVNDERGYALRFSSDPRHPGGFFDVDASGEFLQRFPLPGLDGSPAEWHLAEVEVGPTGGTVWVDGAPAGTLPGPLATQGKVGFWGGWLPAAVDDVELLDAQGALLLRESFAYRYQWNSRALGALALLVIVSGLACGIALRRGGAHREVLGYLLSLLLCLASGAYTCLLARPYLQSLYPKAASLAVVERSWFDDLLIRRDARIMETPPAKPAGVALRMMFVGTSQTYGMGAMRQVDSFVPQLQRKFDAMPFANGRVEIVNAAVPGANTALLFADYANHWLTLNPDIVVFNFGCNDPATTEFETNLENMARAAQDIGASVLFIKEPTIPGMVDQIDWKYAAIARVATSLNAPLIDAQSYMLSVKDSGFLWWDKVHPTDYGHRLLADYLYPILRDAASARLAAP